jgi:hypothetical protein
LIYRDHFSRIELTSHTGVQYWQGLCANVFSQLEIFKETQTKSLKIIGRWPMSKFKIPSIDHQLSFFYWSDGFFPLVTLCQIKSFNNSPGSE